MDRHSVNPDLKFQRRLLIDWTPLCYHFLQIQLCHDNNDNVDAYNSNKSTKKSHLYVIKSTRNSWHKSMASHIKINHATNVFAEGHFGGASIIRTVFDDITPNLREDTDYHLVLAYWCFFTEIFNCIGLFLNWNVWILSKEVQIRNGLGKGLAPNRMTRFTDAYICVTAPQYIKRR